MDETTVGTGMITGGWEYVWTVYIATWAVVLGYAAFAILRSRTGPSRPPEPTP
jgi:hypothetical protein